MFVKYRIFRYNCSIMRSVKTVSMAKKIKMILVERDMTIRELSEKMGYKNSYLYNKLHRDNMSEKELKEIADALDCDYDGIFTFRDSGKQI